MRTKSRPVRLSINAAFMSVYFQASTSCEPGTPRGGALFGSAQVPDSVPYRSSFLFKESPSTRLILPFPAARSR
jgi:hypothetical protein